MPQVRVDQLMEEMSSEFGRALYRTFQRRYPQDPVSRHLLLKEFRRELNRICNTWSDVSDDVAKCEAEGPR
jgi:hypothetical protein